MFKVIKRGKQIDLQFWAKQGGRRNGATISYSEALSLIWQLLCALPRNLAFEMSKHLPWEFIPR
jgi:hypothetical protein